jgi:predicted methyltransferase
MKKLAELIVIFMFCGSVLAADLPVEARIEQAMLGKHRSAENQARNQYRHPVGTLTFLGLQDGMTVLEITPGAGWYSEVLAPVMRQHGQYIVAVPDDDVAGQPEYRYELNKELRAKFAASPGLYDQVAVVPFSPPQTASLGAPDSIDLVLTFRNTHGWITEGIATQMFAEFARVLKPGGILGLVQHRAENGTDPKVTAELGYVSEQAVISLALAAGLYLEARSEVNANPADRKDYPEGVWTLPPGLAVCSELTNAEEKAACEAPFIAIGESDRMTLRFRKPVN